MTHDVNPSGGATVRLWGAQDVLSALVKQRQPLAVGASSYASASTEEILYPRCGRPPTLSFQRPAAFLTFELRSALSLLSPDYSRGELRERDDRSPRGLGSPRDVRSPQPSTPAHAPTPHPALDHWGRG